MTEFEERGKNIREQCESLVLYFMSSTAACQPNGSGMKQSQIFKACGLDFGDYDKVTSTNQQYLIVAILRELESERKVHQIKESGPWRLHNVPQSI